LAFRERDSIAVAATNILTREFGDELKDKIDAELVAAAGCGLRLAAEALVELRALGSASRIFRGVVGHLTDNMTEQVVRELNVLMN
jgi:hypothetical protein